MTSFLSTTEARKTWLGHAFWSHLQAFTHEHSDWFWSRAVASFTGSTTPIRKCWLAKCCKAVSAQNAPIPAWWNRMKSNIPLKTWEENTEMCRIPICKGEGDNLLLSWWSRAFFPLNICPHRIRKQELPEKRTYGVLVYFFHRYFCGDLAVYYILLCAKQDGRAYQL